MRRSPSRRAVENWFKAPKMSGRARGLCIQPFLGSPGPASPGAMGAAWGSPALEAVHEIGLLGIINTKFN